MPNMAPVADTLLGFNPYPSSTPPFIRQAIGMCYFVRGVAWSTWVFLFVSVLAYASTSVGCTNAGYEYNTTNAWYLFVNNTMPDRVVTHQTEDEVRILPLLPVPQNN